MDNNKETGDHDGVECNSDGKNAQDAYCKVDGCNSLVFRADTAPLIQSEQKLPLNGTDETVRQFWQFNDMFQFENVTFTREAETDSGKIKYLACCDCEFGPIGYQNLDTKVCYVATDRVRYKS